VNLFSNGEKKNKNFGIVYWSLRTLYYYYFFFRLYYWTLLHFCFFFVSGECVRMAHISLLHTHIRYFFCVLSLHGFLLYPGTVLFCFFFVIFFLDFFSSNLNLFNLFWFFIHVVNDLIFLLFSLINSVFFSFFLLLFALFFSIHLFAPSPTTCTTNEK
jgi:hypothetical protein